MMTKNIPLDNFVIARKLNFLGGPRSEVVEIYGLLSLCRIFKRSLLWSVFQFGVHKNISSCQAVQRKLQTAKRNKRLGVFKPGQKPGSCSIFCMPIVFWKAAPVQLQKETVNVSLQSLFQGCAIAFYRWQQRVDGEIHVSEARHTMGRSSFPNLGIYSAEGHRMPCCVAFFPNVVMRDKKPVLIKIIEANSPNITKDWEGFSYHWLNTGECFGKVGNLG